MKPPRLPTTFRRACTRLGVTPTRHVFSVCIAEQRAALFELTAQGSRQVAKLVEEFSCSTSKFGIGQVAGSNCTPLGLHRIAEKHEIGRAHV